MTPRSLTAACTVGVVLVALALVVPSTEGRGPEMDEGAVVAYAARVLDGSVPHRDFLTFYGPGNPWLVAGAFELFGARVITERAVGVLYRLIIVLALFALGRALGGLVGGALAGVLSAMFMAKELIWAYASYGAIAFGLLGVALGVAGAGRAPGQRRDLWFLGAGAASGAAILIRFDLTPAVVLAALPLLAFVAWRSRIWFGVGFVALAGVYVPHLAIVGPERVGRVVADLRASGPERTLPLPTVTGYPGNLLAAALLTTVVFVVLGIVLALRDRRALAPRVLVSVGLFSAALLPTALSRADPFHVRPFALVPMCLLPAAALFLVRWFGFSRRGQVLIAATLSLLALVTMVSIGALGRVSAWRSIDDDYHGFYRGDADPARAVVAEAARLARPGDSLFVGPQDLRRTNYGPTYMYFLLPQLRPASYYMEMNPLTASRPGSGLSDELRRADWLILTSKWDYRNKPRDSSQYGPAEPNEVVRSSFCLRLESGQYRLYEQCGRA